MSDHPDLRIDPLADPDRLSALHESDLLDTPPEENFDRLTRIAARLLGAPLAQVNFMDDRRQVSKSSVAPPEWTGGREIPLEDSFCRYTIVSREPLLVEDARTNPLVSGTATVTTHGLIAYAGIPLITPEGYAIGTLCVGDFQARRWTQDELEVLGDLADAVTTEIELRRENRRHRRVRRQLAESQRAVVSLLTHMPGAAYRLRNEPDWPVELISPGVTELTGYTPEDFISGTISFADIIHPDDRSRVWNAVQAALYERRPYRLEYRIRTRTGEERWVWEQGEGTYSAEGVLALEGFIKDATDRKRAEAELLASEATLRAVFDATPDTIQMLDPGGRFRWVSPAARETLGYDHDALVGTAIVDLLHPDDRERFETTLREVLDGTRHELQLRFRARSRAGAWEILEARGRAITGADVEGAVLVVRNVTAQVRLEESARESETRFRQIAESVRDVFWMAPADLSQVLYVSPAYEEIWGRSTDSLYANPHDWLEAIVEDDRERFLKLLASDRLREQGFEMEHRIRRPDGEIRWIHARGFPVLDATGEFYRIVGVSEDVTERKRTEEALHAAVEEAERANRAKSEFLSRMSHELRTPLNAILGFAQLLNLDPGVEDQESVEQILRAGRHLLVLIDEVLDLAKIEAERLTLSIEPVDLMGVVRESFDLVRSMAAQQGVTLQIGDGWGRSAAADPHRLKQVLLNLLTNGIKYNHRGGYVRVSCTQQPRGTIRIRVSDTGTGISPEHIDRVFTPFERLGAEEKEVEGTGLGLALSRRLVEAMGGEIGVESVPGRGTTFWVDLPAVEPEPGAAESGGDDEQGGAGAPLHGHTILYVEDNPANLRLVERILARRPGTVLVSAPRGQMGLALARARHPSLILLDLNLPDMTGLQVLEQIQRDPELQSIPVVVISADATPGRPEDFLGRGAYGYLSKPFDVQHFIETVNQALGATGAQQP